MKVENNYKNIIKKNPIFIAIINIILLSYAHISGNSMILFLCNILFCAIILLSKKKFFIPLMLFYLPWNPVLKVQPNGYTFYTLIVPLLFIYLILYKKKINLQVVLLTLALVILTIVGKMLNQYNFNFSYIYIMMMFLFIPYYYYHYNDELSFQECIYYLTFGIITACISSQILMKYPHMLNYIVIDRVIQTGLTRLNGFYGDANFYSAQILVAITGILILILKNKENMIINFILMLTLIFFGLQSVSKMFLLCCSITITIWIMILIAQRTSIIKKFKIIAILFVIIILGITLNIFEEQISYYVIRFTYISDINSLTTGRSSIIENYISYFKTNIETFLFGIGISHGYVEGRASHNTIIQIIYQVGIIGSVIIILWIKKVFGSFKINQYTILMFIGFFTSWLSLDMLMFDEFFYFITLFFIGLKYIVTNKNSEKESIYVK